MVPDEFIKTPPKDHLIQALYVKHVEIRGRWVQGPMRYDEVKGGNLILDYLISAKGPRGPHFLLYFGQLLLHFGKKSISG